MLTIFLEIDVGGGLHCAKEHGNDLFCRSTVHSLNLGKCILQLQLWQPTVTFHNFLRRGCEDNFWQISSEIDVLLFLRGKGARRSPSAYATDFNHNLQEAEHLQSTRQNA